MLQYELELTVDFSFLMEESWRQSQIILCVLNYLVSLQEQGLQFLLN